MRLHISIKDRQASTPADCVLLECPVWVLHRLVIIPCRRYRKRSLRRWPKVCSYKKP